MLCAFRKSAYREVPIPKSGNGPPVKDDNCSRDRNTMTAHANEWVAQGVPMSGLFVIPEHMSIGQAALELETLALASESHEWHDRVIFLPL
jgi:hypothetical protein